MLNLTLCIFSDKCPRQKKFQPKYFGMNSILFYYTHLTIHVYKWQDIPVVRWKPSFKVTNDKVTWNIGRHELNHFVKSIKKLKSWLIFLAFIKIFPFFIFDTFYINDDATMLCIGVGHRIDCRQKYTAKLRFYRKPQDFRLHTISIWNLAEHLRSI